LTEPAATTTNEHDYTAAATPYDSGYSHGCSDAKISTLSERYINQSERYFNNADRLGLNPNLPIWVRRLYMGEESLHIHETGQPIIELVVELLQRRKVPLDPDDPHSPSFTFRGGTTLILDKYGQVRYIIHKKIGDEKKDDENKRLKRQRDYLNMYKSNLAMASYADDDEIHKRITSPDFRMIHRGY
jgi:hypothetical protein